MLTHAEITTSTKITCIQQQLAIRFKGRLTRLLLLNGHLYLFGVCLDQDVDLRKDTKKSYMFGRDRNAYS